MPLTEVDLLARYLRLRQCPAAGGTDGELLDRFAAGDEAAFADVLRRHGPMVRGVCLRLLGEPGQADDAFQATFLALAQRAGSVQQRESVGSWLYGVAWRLAHKARRADTRRRRHERAAAEERRPGTADPRWAELLGLLDEELSRLPDQARAPLLLCYLQGFTQDEAANSLGWSVGTLRRRLERGRELLRTRLASRGATLPAALFAGALAPGGATAAVSDGLLAETVRAATAAALSAGWSWGRKVAVLVLLSAGVMAAGAVGQAFFAEHREEAGPPVERAAEAKPAPAAGKDPQGDPLPEGALMRFGSTRFRHPGGVHGAALSPDSKTLVTGGKFVLRLFDVDTGRARQTLADPHFPEPFWTGSTTLGFSPDGRLLLVSAVEGARLLDAATGAELWRSDGVVPAAGPGGARGGPFMGGMGCGVAFSPDGKQFAVVGEKAMVFYDTVGKKEQLRVPKVGKEDERWFAYAPTGDLVALLGATADAVRLCDAATGKVVRSIKNGAEVEAVSFSPDGKTLAVAGKDKAVRLWGVADGKEVRAMRDESAPKFSPVALAFAPDGKTLAVASSDHAIRLFGPADGKLLHRLKGHTGYITAMLFSRDGKTLYSGSWDKTVRRWDARSGAEVRGPADDFDQSHMARSADGKLVATGGNDGPVTLWEAATGRRLRLLRGHERWVSSLAFSPDGQRLALGGWERAVRVWDVAGGKEERLLDCGIADKKRQGRVESVAFSPDGRLIAACDNERNVVHLWDAGTGKKVRELTQPSPRTLAFAADGKTLAVGGNSPAVELWDLATGRKVRSITGGAMTQNTNAVAFSPDGRLIATGHHGTAVHLWDAATGRPVREILVGHDVTWCLAFSPDGAWLATGGLDGTAALWEVATGRPLHRLRKHDFWVLNLAFGPDGRTLATGGYDGTSLLWTLKPKLSPAAAGLALLWEELQGEDAARAYRAAWAMAEQPDKALPFLKERLRRKGPPLDKERVRRLTGDLGSDAFATREAASRELDKLGTAVEAELRAALAAVEDLEVRRRLGALLKGMQRELSAEQLRRTRAASALRLIGGREAGELLRGLADR